MLILELISQHWRAADLVKGEEWFFLAEAENYAIVAHPICGDDHFLLRDRKGAASIYQFSRRAVIARLQLPAHHHHLALQALTDAQGKLLYSLENDENGGAALLVIDVQRGEALHHWRGLPRASASGGECFAMRPDGALVYVSQWMDGETRRSRSIRIDPESGEWEESRIFDDLDAGRDQCGAGNRFISVSPEGSYALRPELNRLAIHAPPRRFLFGGRDADKRYGLTMQLWQAYPLRFLRHLPVGWRDIEAMPDAALFSMQRDFSNPIGARRRVWDTIASALEKAADLDPLAPPLPRSAFPAHVQNDDGAWSAVAANRVKLWETSKSVMAWQQDEAAFWMQHGSHVVCVGVDGELSPPLNVSLDNKTHLELGHRMLEALPNRQARLEFDQNVAIVDGASSAEPTSLRLLRRGEFEWLDDETAPNLAARKVAKRAIEAREAAMSRIRIAVPDATAEGAIHAIEALTTEFNPGFQRRSNDRHLQLSFVLDGEELSEATFFRRLRTFPEAAPALRRAIERYLEILPQGEMLFCAEEPGGDDRLGFLVEAATTLAILDRDSLPLIIAFGDTIDREHEYRFAGIAVPAVLARYGWSDATLDFAFWFLMSNYYNSYCGDAAWIGLGLREAVEVKEPAAYARHIAARFGYLLDRDRSGNVAVSPGVRHFKRLSSTRWLRAFLAEMERLRPELFAQAS